MEEEQCSLSPYAILAVVVPAVVYWECSGLYMLLGSSFHQYRLLSAEDEDLKNLVSERHVVKTVLLQQFVQITGEGRQCSTGTRAASPPPPPAPAVVLVVARQVIVGMLVLTRGSTSGTGTCMRTSSCTGTCTRGTHRLVVPYAFGSQYNHPAEAFFSLCTMRASTTTAACGSPATSSTSGSGTTQPTTTYTTSATAASTTSPSPSSNLGQDPRSSCRGNA